MYCLMKKLNVFRTDRDIAKAWEFPGAYLSLVQSALEMRDTLEYQPALKYQTSTFLN